MSFKTTTGKLFFAFLFLLGFFNFPKAFCGNDQQIWIGLTDPDDIYNETLITFLPNATDTVDAFHDSYRMLVNPGFDIYSKIGIADFKAQALPPLTNDKTVTLGIDATISGPYILRLDRFEHIDESVVILLEDTFTGVFQNLRLEPLYAFHLDSAINIQRFKIHFYPPFDFTSTNITCAGNPGAVHLSQPGNHFWNYELKNETGATIDSDPAFHGMKTLDNVNEGIYTITLLDSFGYQITKQIVLDGKEPVTAQFEVSDEELQVEETLHFFDYSVGASNLIWNFGDGTVINGNAFPTHSFSQAGEYEVLVTASNTECLDIMSKTITVLNQFTGINNTEEKFVNIASSGNTLAVQFPNPQYGFADVQIFNLLGQKIIDEKVVAIGKREFEIIGNGYFLVKVTMNRKSVEKKIFIQGW
ncbi:MAG: PKD domain-containing protein [Chitinophagales bacterium]|nr:PKD domain-containing protein [Chitinophagales bacterium]